MKHNTHYVKYNMAKNKKRHNHNSDYAIKYVIINSNLVLLPCQPFSNAHSTS